MATQIYKRPFRAAKEPVQALDALDSFLPYGKKIWSLTSLSSGHGVGWWSVECYYDYEPPPGLETA